MKSWIKFSLLTTLSYTLFGAQFASAAIAEQAPLAKEWIETLTDKDFAVLSAPRSVTVVESFGPGGSANGIPKFKVIEHSKCNEISFFRCTSGQDSNFSASINSSASVKGVDGAANLTGVDLVVYPGQEGTMIAEPQKKWTSRLLFDKQIFATFDIGEFIEQVFESLGYDGVVLAKRGDFLLIATTEKRLQKENLQGLLISGSSQRRTLDKSRRKGAGLLSLLNTWHGYGVFQEVAVSTQTSKSEIGSKILLESK